MKYIAIDQSYTSSGVILFEDESIVKIERVSTSKEDDMFKRATQIATRIVEIANAYQPEFVVLEGLAFGMRGSATRDLAGLQFIITVFLRELNNFDVVIIAPLTAKKFATGSGKAEKTQMFEVLPESVKTYLVDIEGFKKTKGLYDITDAYWIGLTARHAKLNPDFIKPAVKKKRKKKAKKKSDNE